MATFNRFMVTFMRMHGKLHHGVLKPRQGIWANTTTKTDRPYTHPARAHTLLAFLPPRMSSSPLQGSSKGCTMPNGCDEAPASFTTPTTHMGLR